MRRFSSFISLSGILGQITTWLVLASFAVRAAAASTNSASPSLASNEVLALRGVRDLSGKPAYPFDSKTKGTVLVFLSPDCPISNRYAPEIQRLAKKFAPRGIVFWLVYPDPDLAPATIQTHLKEYGYSLPALRDTEQQLVQRTHAQVTPEAAVFASDGTLLYRGRIDDRFVDFGKQRAAPTERDLDRALHEYLAGKPIRHPVTKAIGCDIPSAKNSRRSSGPVP